VFDDPVGVFGVEIGAGRSGPVVLLGVDTGAGLGTVAPALGWFNGTCILIVGLGAGVVRWRRPLL
jgi:hypothetical protein